MTWLSVGDADGSKAFFDHAKLALPDHVQMLFAIILDIHSESSPHS